MRHGGDRSEASRPDHALERLVFFSDAVFAIAITLLVIEIHVPEVEGTADLDFIRALAQLAPNFTGFFISFFVIGAFWAGHNRAFGCARHWSPRLIGPNLMLLATIAAMPFFTAFASDYWNQRVPSALYCGWLLLTALFSLRLQRVVLSPPVVDEAVPAPELAAIRRRGISVALGAATALAVSFVVPFLGQVSLMAIPLWRLMLDRLAARSA